MSFICVLQRVRIPYRKTSFSFPRQLPIHRTLDAWNPILHIIYLRLLYYGLPKNSTHFSAVRRKKCTKNMGNRACFWGRIIPKYSEVTTMKGRTLTAAKIAEFKAHLMLEERSAATIEKYISDVAAFASYAQSGKITKETVITYKKHLQKCYAVRSINSMLAGINSLFSFLGWHDLKVKALKLQQQVYCPEEKELTKAEYARLCRAAERKHNERLSLILQTICGTGIRVSELQYITVEAAKRGEAVVPARAKHERYSL